MIARDDVDLFDVLIFFAENWLWILLLPLLVAVLAYGAVEFWPPRYTATAIFTLHGEDDAAFEQAVAAAYGRASSSDSVKITRDGGISITVSAPSADEAEAEAAAVYSHVTEPIRLAAQTEIDRISALQGFLQERLDGLTTLGTPEAVIGIPSFLTVINDFQKEKAAPEAVRDQYMRPDIEVKSAQPSAALVAAGLFLVTSVIAAAIRLIVSWWAVFADTLRRRHAAAGRPETGVVEEVRSMSTAPG